MEPFRDFKEAATAILSELHHLWPHQVWMIARSQPEYWIVLHAVDRGYGLRNGDLLMWSETFRSHLCEGDGPNISSDARNIPVNREGWSKRALDVGRYVGVPLRRRDGTLLATLCGLDPEPGRAPSEATGRRLATLTRVLASLLVSELDSEALVDVFTELQSQTSDDPLTGLHNRRGWDEAVESAEGLCRRLGTSASVLYIDLDDLKETNDRFGHQAGDRLIIRAAEALTSVTRESDYVARVGGDEFGVLAMGCNAELAERLANRVLEGLEGAGVNASVGLSTRDPDGDLWSTISQADQSMYERKRAKRG